MNSISVDLRAESDQSSRESMGLLRFLRSMAGRRLNVKIMSADGSCKKYKAPLSVKEVLSKHPQHLLFNAETIQKLGSWARPLPESRLLDPGKLYVIIPAVPTHDINDSLPRAFHSMPLAPSSSRSLSSHEENERSLESRAASMPHGRPTGRVSFALAEGKEEGKQVVAEEEKKEKKKKKMVSFAECNKESMERRVSSMPRNLLLELDPSASVESRTQSLPRIDVSEGMDALRVKVVVTKKQLESLLQDEKGDERRALLESLVASASKKGLEDPPHPTWKPSLDCIPESKP